MVPKADHDKDHSGGGHTEPDRSKYDQAGKGRDPDKLKEIPTDRLKEFQKHDNDAWRQGEVQKELERRASEAANRDRKAEGHKGPREGGRTEGNKGGGGTAGQKGRGEGERSGGPTSRDSPGHDRRG